MDLKRILSELYSEREKVKKAIRSLEGCDPPITLTTDAAAQSFPAAGYDVSAGHDENDPIAR